MFTLCICKLLVFFLEYIPHFGHKCYIEPKRLTKLFLFLIVNAYSNITVRSLAEKVHYTAGKPLWRQ
ncbi:hypothetical protein FKM82_017692 [Ascaphus truei]